MSVYMIQKPSELDKTQPPIDNVSETGEKKGVTTSTVEQPKPNEKIKDKIIVLDGPLSKIYTEALNTVLSNETMTNAILIADQNITEIPEDKESLYVYCCDGDDLDNDSLKETTGKLQMALDSNKYSKVLLSMECSKANSHIALLDSFAHSLTIPIKYKRSTSIEAIKDF